MEAIEIFKDLLDLPSIGSMVSKVATSGDTKKIRGGIRNLESLIELSRKLGVDNTVIESVIEQLKILVEGERRYINK